MKSYLKHYIDGQWVESDGKERLEVINPSTEAPASEIMIGSEVDVDRAVAAARRAFESFSLTTIEERISLFERIIEEYNRRIEDIAVTISEEIGTPIDFAVEKQAPLALTHFTGMLKHLREFQFSEQLEDSRVIYEPIGVIGMITPWNWPILQISAKVAPALAAGNTIVLKPSSESPGSAMIFAEIFDKAGVPPGVFNVVTGGGSNVGALLSAHPDVDMISITGSTPAGIAVAKAAADTVKRVHQELGGKAPNLVLEGADLESVLPPTIDGVLANSGQSCISPTRLLVHKSQVAQASAIVTRIMEAVEIDDGSRHGSHIGPVVNKAQFEKINALIQSAIDEGATLVTGGPGLPAGRTVGFFIKPTLFTGVTPEMRIFREEIFGPVATITAYDTLEQAIALANDTEFGLSAVISGDPVEAAKIVPKIRAGLIGINSWLGSTQGAFGGYKKSGNGREGGKYGLAEFMESKSVVGEVKDPR